MSRGEPVRAQVTKGVHLGLRQLGLSPEVVAARRLASTMPETSGAYPDVLILSMRDWAVHVHLEAILGLALRLRGARVRHLTCGGALEICDRTNTWEAPPMPCRSCTRYVSDTLRAYGHTSVRLRDAASSEGDWPELDAMSFEELQAVTFRSIPLGRLVTIPVTWFLLAAPIEDDPLGRLTFRAFLRSARAIVERAEVALDSHPVDRVVMLNGTFLFEAIVWELCRQRAIPVVTYERGHILDSFLFALEEPAGLADLHEVWNAWRDVPLTADESRMLDEYLADRLVSRKASDSYWHDARFDVPPDRPAGRRAVMFTNLVWDSAVVGQDVAFLSIVDWIITTVDVFAGRPLDELVIRIHPAEEKLAGRESRVTMQATVTSRRPNLPANVRFVGSSDPLSSYALMDSADVGLVYSSTTGLELALAGKPVLVAARTHFRDKGFTVDASTPDEHLVALQAVLDDPSSFAPDVELARRYAYLFFYRAPVTNVGVHESIRGLASLVVRRASDLRRDVAPELNRVCRHILDASSFAPAPGTEPGGSSTSVPVRAPPQFRTSSTPRGRRLQ
jgi:hypothetical protein